MDLPQRRPLHHTPPDFAPAGATFFITVCAQPRGTRQLVEPAAWAALQNAAAHFHAAARWHLRLLLAMPDHVHLLASFPATESMARVVAAWKHYTSRHAAIAWQRDFFDHRLRNDESLDEKAAYIRQNPVRAGIAPTADAWTCVWSPPDLPATPR